jgi:broad specificity phosphatase PhoE
MGVVLLVRHGQASFGTDDYDVLSETGWEQARLLGAWLAGRGVTPDVVVRGGMRRHRETAEGDAGEIGLAAFVRRADELAESYGERFRPTAYLRGLASSGGAFPA